MISPTRVLRAAGDGPLELESIVNVLVTQFAVSAGSRQPVRRRRVDTFDRRLHAAGLTLEHQISTPDERLVLGRKDGVALTMPVQSLSWPALAEALPAGPVRDAIAPVIGIRALMVASDERRLLRRLDLLNDEGKTVARVELDEPAFSAAAPAQVVVRRLRGYDHQARRAEHLLGLLALTAVENGRGQEPGAQATVSGPDRSTSPVVILSAALGGFLVTMRENVPGLLDDVDTEFLHDFRVAVRRTRATLKLGRPVLPALMRSRWEPAFKSLGDLTTPVRDLDVYQLDLPTMRRALMSADPTDLDALARHLRKKRKLARRVLVRSLKSAGFAQMLAQWGQELAGLGQGQEDPGRETLSAGAVASSSISRAYRRVARAGALIGPDSPAEELHGLRKRCKELRYALELFAPLIDPAARARAVTNLKGLQDVLGRIQDTQVQRRAMCGFAQEMMSEGTTAQAVLAMGELIGHLDVEQGRARREFEASFAALERPSGLRRMRHLGGPR